jgi:glycerol-3-phosphate dehydrogenase
VEDSRLVILNALDAAERGATILTQTRVTHGEAVDGVWSITCERRDTGRPLLLRARTLVNATGAWVNELLGLLEIAPRQQVRLVKGSHLVLHRQFAGEHAYLLQSPDRRVVFAIPFEQHYTLVGTTDAPFTGDPAQVTIDVAERDYLLGCVNRFFKRQVTPADIAGSYAGVRPLFDDGSQGAAQQASRDYHLELQQAPAGAPVLTVYGGKITTYRKLAEAALPLLLQQLGQAQDEASWTADEALPGGDLPAADLQLFSAHALQRWPGLPPNLILRLARLYGTRMTHILGDARCMEDLGARFGEELTLAEVRYLVAREWARSAQDILWRRTRLGLRFPASAVDQLQDAVTQLLG